MTQLTRWASGTITSVTRKIETCYAKIAEPRHKQRSVSSNDDQMNNTSVCGIEHSHTSMMAPPLRQVKRRSWGLSSLCSSIVNSLSAMSPYMIDPVRLPIPEQSIAFTDDSSTFSGETLNASVEP
ncbi:hypothetical protein OIDMADRAFT_61510 [Oidiodendron maius Zn]|uniref:Uncharacterized protein n=1 Tax=Oidiodendron maius (strain Zn) TaxID=913774 RepID=A0A0C3CV50_OIDMZ|nr:hypothetical protein OIDMADRAFT_61510 [Oidiodendron maius Zn]